MTKKIIIVLLAIILTLGLVACKKDENPQYTVSFVDRDGAMVAELVITDEKLEMPEGPEIPGYAFKGWYLYDSDSDFKLYKDYFLINPATESVTAYPRYEKLEHTLTFKGIDKKIKISDKKIELPEAPEIPDAIFTGWKLDGENVMLTEDYFVKNPSVKNVSASPVYTFSQFTATPKNSYQCIITGIEGEVDGEIVTMTNVEIPEMIDIMIDGKINSYSVVAIADRAFANRTDIKTVKIPESVEKIGNNVFEGCTKITEVTFTSPDVTIGKNIFMGVRTIATITGPSGVVAKLDKSILNTINLTTGDITDAAFSGAKNLKAVYISAAIENIAEDAFTYCPNLSTIVVDSENLVYTSGDKANCIVHVVNNYEIEDTVGSEIPDGDNNWGIVETLIVGCKNTVIYDGIETIGAYAFDGCSGLTELLIPASVTTIREGAFEGCTGLAKIEVDRNNKKYISSNNCLILDYYMELIQGCKNSKIGETIYVRGQEKKLKAISEYAFKGCTGLTSIYIPETVEKLIPGSFDGCTSLNTIEIRNLELTIDGDVFSNCTNIKNVVIPMDWVDYFVDKSSATLNSVGILSGDKIKENCFVGCNKLTQVTLHDGLTEIGAGAFKNCNELTNFVITGKSELAVIGADAFSGCYKFSAIVIDELVAMVIPSSVTTIGNGAFAGTGITSLSFAANDKIVSIGSGVFAGCSDLRTVVIPSFTNEVVLDAQTFSGCEITSVTAPAKYISSLDNANHSKVTTLTITEGVIGTDSCSCIKKMSGLTTLTIGKGVTDIDNSVFVPNSIRSAGMSKLKTINVEAGNEKYSSVNNAIVETNTAALTRTATMALILGSNSTTAIPAGVTTIKSYAFTGSKIISLTIPGGVKLEANAFYYASVAKLTIAADAEFAEGTIANSTITHLTIAENAIVTKNIFTGSTITNLTISGGAEINSNAFSGSTVSNLTVVDGAKIAANAFESCSGLTKVVVYGDGAGVDLLAFTGCDTITDAMIPAGLSYAISNASLKNLEITQGVIPANAFKDSIKLNVVKIAVGVTAEDGAFAGCTNVANLEAPSSLLRCFIGSRVSTLIINSIDSDITRALMENYTGVKNLTIAPSDNESKVEADAFMPCINLTTADIPTWALSRIYTRELNTLIINSGKRVEGDFRFPKLQNVTFGASIEYVDAIVFSESTILATIQVDPANKTFDVEESRVYEIVGEDIYIVTGYMLVQEHTLVLGAVITSGTGEFVLTTHIRAIGDYAFANRVAITSIVFYELRETDTIDEYLSVTKVGNYAFLNCDKLNVGKFPNIIESIGDGAFKNCVKITYIILPKVTSIGKEAFLGCTHSGLTDRDGKYILGCIEIPVVVTIGEDAFKDCDRIEYAIAPAHAIPYLPKTPSRLQISSGRLEAHSIVGFNNLITLQIGQGVTYISTLVMVPSEEDGGETDYVNQLTTLEVVGSVDGKAANASYYYYSRNNCIITRGEDAHILVLGANIANITIFKDVVKIADRAFLHCNNIESVKFEAAVISISSTAFLGSTSKITSLTVVDGNGYCYSQNNCILSNVDSVVTLILGCQNSIVPMNVDVIGDYAFAGAFVNNASKVEIRLPSHITKIGAHAFEGCKMVDKVIIVEGEYNDVFSVGESAFKGCTALKIVIIPKTVDSIGTDAFDNFASGINILWSGTEAEYDAVKDTTCAPITSAKIYYYYSELYNPERYWYYKDEGQHVNLWENTGH